MRINNYSPKFIMPTKACAVVTVNIKKLRCILQSEGGYAPAAPS